MLSFFTNTIIFIFVIAFVPKITQKINHYLGKKFSISEERKNEIEKILSEDTQTNLKKYRTLEVFIAIPFVVIGFLLVLINPVGLLLYELYPETVMIMWSPLLLLMIFGSIGLIMILAGYIANYTIRLIYKVFNPSKDSIIMFYSSDEANKAKMDGSCETSYDLRSFLRAFLLGSLLIYFISAYFMFFGLDIITKDAYHSRSPVFIFNKTYPTEQLKYYLEENKTRQGEIWYKLIVMNTENNQKISSEGITENEPAVRKWEDIGRTVNIVESLKANFKGNIEIIKKGELEY